jgi:hypothetical protein
MVSGYIFFWSDGWREFDKSGLIGGRVFVT